MKDDDITVIIPTTGELHRSSKLFEAISSVKDQEGLNVHVLVVLNGKKYSQSVYARLSSMKDVSLIYVEKGSLPLAIAKGCCQVGTFYFSFLDDDDIYLPNTLLPRVLPLIHDKTLGMTVCNGIKTIGGEEKLIHSDMLKYSNDPLLSLIEKGNWLASCGGVFRKDIVTLDYFDPELKYYEWTLVAFKISLSKIKIKFIDNVCFRINDTENSLSKSFESQDSEYRFMFRLMSYSGITDEVNCALKKKTVNASHNLSVLYMKRREFKTAWKYHVLSIINLYGFSRYILYTRYLLMNGIRNILS